MSSQGILWSDNELRVAVEAYLYILRLQQAGIPCSLSDMTSFLLSGPLSERSDASIHYRMKNISDVLQKKGWPVVKSYSPAPHVGSGVRDRINEILDSLSGSPLLPELTPLSSDSLSGREELKQEAHDQLDQLYKALTEIETGAAGIGHNHPPEPIEDVPLSQSEVSAAKEAIQDLKIELNKPAPERRTVDEKKDMLLRFGLKLALWTAARGTKFVDVAMVPVATAVGIGLMPKIIDAMQAVIRFMESFL